MRTRRHVAAVCAALLAATLMAGCGGDKKDKLSANDGPVEGGAAITPAKLTAHKGREVEITVTNTAKDKQHGFAIDEFGVKETIDQGKSTTVKFKADKTGTFKVYCQLHNPAHKAAELVVS